MEKEKVKALIALIDEAFATSPAMRRFEQSNAELDEVLERWRLKKGLFWCRVCGAMFIGGWFTMGQLEILDSGWPDMRRGFCEDCATKYPLDYTRNWGGFWR